METVPAAFSQAVTALKKSTTFIKGGKHMATQRKVLPPVKEKRISLRVIDALYETMAADAEMTSEYRRE